MSTRQRDPITRITLKGGRTRYRFVIDVGTKGQRKQQTHTCDALREAKDLRAQMLADKSKGKVVTRTKITFDELCGRWLTSRHDIREITRVGYDYVLRAVRSEIGAKRVQDITRADVDAMIKILQAKGVGHRGIVYTLGTVRQVLAYGCAEGLLAVNVAASVKAPRKAHSDARTVQTWDPDHLDAFRVLADRESLEWAVAWRLTLCGLRRSEVLGLSWDVVDLERGEITVRAGRVLLGDGRTAVDDPKSAASWRTVAVEETQSGTVAMLRALKAHQAAQRLALGGWPAHGLVVVNDEGLPVRPEMYSDRFHVLSHDAGLPVVRLHAIRHTLALIGHRNGVAPVDMAAFLGHSLETHIKTYLPRSERGARSAAAALGRVMSRSM